MVAKSRGYSDRVQLGCLLHDASESYISDLTRPVKCNLPEYLAIEERLQKVIYDRFGLGDLSDDERKQIEEVDDTLLYYEFAALMDFPLFDSPPYKAMEHNFSQLDFTGVEKEFLKIFNVITHNRTGFICVGIDGCKGGWVVVVIRETDFKVNIIKSIDEVFNRYNEYDSVIVDMPIGLPESKAEDRPDGKVRARLKGKASSIFNTPCRQAVNANSYEEANQINRKILDKGLSKQSYAICRKIQEIDEFLSNNPQHKNQLVESHPELCFAVLNLGEPLYDNKHTDVGLSKRVHVLGHYYEQAQDVIKHAQNNEELKNCLDDVVDALCLAIIGMLGLKNGFKTIPENPKMDRQGILMQMVYAETSQT
ncbi:MAG: DUF429 domain-containing protein [Peptococcaceae bacterium]|nr:DUF429 domain-containing protein [Peptococcaceae bacterium]